MLPHHVPWHPAWGGRMLHLGAPGAHPRAHLTHLHLQPGSLSRLRMIGSEFQQAWPRRGCRGWGAGQQQGRQGTCLISMGCRGLARTRLLQAMVASAASAGEAARSCCWVGVGMTAAAAAGVPPLPGCWRPRGAGSRCPPACCPPPAPVSAGPAYPRGRTCRPSCHRRYSRMSCRH